MTLRRLSALLLVVTLTSAPVAEGAATNWGKRLLAADELLRKGEYEPALRIALKVVGEMGRMLAAGDNSERAFGTALSVLALAEAGTGEVDAGRWHWYLAQSFNGALIGQSLAAYGEAGEPLADHRLSPYDPDREQRAPEGCTIEEVAAPKKLWAPQPAYPIEQRQSLFTGSVIVHVTIDENGRPSRPQVLEAPNPSLGFQAAEAVRQWKFAPATCAGRPVAVFYNLTVNFKLRG